MTLGLRGRRTPPAPGAPDRRDRRPKRSTRSLILVVHAVVASVGGIYLATDSILATLIGGAFGVLLAGWLAAVER